ncbi:MAG: hypothetical protein ACOC8H_00785 [bacterium]
MPTCDICGRRLCPDEGRDVDGYLACKQCVLLTRAYKTRGPAWSPETKQEAHDDE